MNKGFLLVVSGPAASGKGSILNRIINNNANVNYSVSATTRKPREGEVDGIHYHFISEEEFMNKVKADLFLEHAYVHVNHYGTLKEHVDEQLEAGKIIILEIDVQGAALLMERVKDLVTVFILPPSYEELENRIRKRGTETEEEMQKRLSNAKKEIKECKKYEYLIINDDLEKAISDLQAIIDAERLKTSRNTYDIEEE